MMYQKAFTLIEGLIVTIIVAILATMAFMSYQGYIVRTRQLEVKPKDAWYRVMPSAPPIKNNRA